MQFAISVFATGALTVITVIALKVFLGISLCSEAGFTLKNVVMVGGQTLLIGIISSIGVNYCLNLWVFSTSEEQTTGTPSDACCRPH